MTTPDAHMPAQGPLADVRVLEIGHYIAAPHCAMMLADQGADVIKLEPPAGDPARQSKPHTPAGESLYFAAHNRRKRSVVLDLRDEAARHGLDALLRWADVVVTNYAYGVPDRLGFGFERLAQVNPRAILVHITGFDSKSQRAHHAAFDGVLQAMSGFADMTGDPRTPPAMSQVYLADHSAGAHAAYAATCALVRRAQTGIGGQIEVNMLDVMTSYLAHTLGDRGLNGASPTRQRTDSSARFAGMFPTNDGVVYIAPFTSKMWRDLCALFGQPAWGDRPPPDPATEAELAAEIRTTALSWFAARTTQEAVATLQSRRIASGPLRTVAQVYDEETASGSRTVMDILLPSGAQAPSPGPAFQFADISGPARVPGLGEHTASVLSHLDNGALAS